MINTYTYIETNHNKLHDFVIAFFDRIEFETGEFAVDFYHQEFYDNLVSHHRGILGKPFKKIYEILKDWTQEQRSEFCEAIRRSNEIRRICQGEIIPWKTEDIPEEVRDITKKIFKQLYEDVLKGEFFQPIYGTRLDHYHEFKQHGTNDYEYCPACGMVEMKTYTEDKSDQYDHYLPKDKYPFSSINFKNLVPICADCNSFEVKSSKDILSFTGRVFYPFDEDHEGININLVILSNNYDLSQIEWQINYSNINGKIDEIEAWKQIYDIEDRHIKYITGRINKWYKHYWDDFNDKDTINDIPEENIRKRTYLRRLKNEKVLKYKALSALLMTLDTRARNEASSYSLYGN